MTRQDRATNPDGTAPTRATELNDSGPVPTIVWNDPLPLERYRYCPTGPGIYAIGRARDPNCPIAPNAEFDAYAFNWPDNLAPLYVGISESSSEGLRRRLRSHFRGRGNKQIAHLLEQGEQLWFVACCGREVVNYEALFLVAFSAGTGFVANRRSETRNFAKRAVRSADAKLRERGFDPDDRHWLDDEDH